MVIVKKTLKRILLMISGGSAYVGIELLWRHYPHWSMFFASGICFVILFELYTGKNKDLTIPEKCVIGSAIITAIEFAAGCIVNIWLGMEVWNYSNLPFNLLGQVCVMYSTLWGLLCLPIDFFCRNVLKIKEKYSKKLLDG